ncbi:hypothetical protein BV898_03788, partial [Hypsibius exemplaris]
MAKYLLHDMQAMLRGIKQVAQISLKIQAAEINERVCQSSLRPRWSNLASSSASSPASSSSPRQSSFNVQEIASRAGAVLRGLEEQVKIVAGIQAPAPILAFDNGFTLYSDKIGSAQNRATRDHPTTADIDDENGHGKPEGEAGKAAKRAEKFMNPPVAPLDESDVSVLANNSLEGDDSHNLKNFGKEETSHLKQDRFSKDSKKTFIDSGGDNLFRPENLKKISKRFYSSLAGSGGGDGRKPSSAKPVILPTVEKQT